MTDYEALSRKQERLEQEELERQERSQGREERYRQLAQRQRAFRQPRREEARRIARSVSSRIGDIAEAGMKTTRESYDKTNRTAKKSKIRQVITGLSPIRGSGREVTPNRGGGLGNRIVAEMSQGYVEVLDRDFFGNRGQPPRDLLGQGNEQRDLLGSSHGPNMDLLGTGVQNPNEKKRLI
jgi:hypothetical protein